MVHRLVMEPAEHMRVLVCFGAQTMRGNIMAVNSQSVNDETKQSDGRNVSEPLLEGRQTNQRAEIKASYISSYKLRSNY
jgi:hypothetical protein